MTQKTLDPYTELLKRYKIKPDYMEDFGKVKKVYSNKGTFALKQVQFTDEQRHHFIYTVQSLHEKGYRHVVPIFPTTDGSYICRHFQYDYYVMPWLESNRFNMREPQEDLMREAARLHTVSMTKGRVNQQYFYHFYENSKLNIEMRKLDYERFIDICEKKIYMSPFELLYCTYFTQFMIIEDLALRQLDNWYDVVKEKKQDRAVLCHGNLSPNHLLYDENGQSYLINFDRSFIASPIYDLLSFFKKMFYQYPQTSSEASHWYAQYNRQNHLTEDERLLLCYYLCQTDHIYKQVKQYQHDSLKPEIKFVGKLQRSIWQTQAAYSFVNQLNEEIEQAKNIIKEENENPK